MNLCKDYEYYTDTMPPFMPPKSSVFVTNGKNEIVYRIQASQLQISPVQYTNIIILVIFISQKSQ